MAAPFAPTLGKPWSAFLNDVDQALSKPVHLHCIGGFVLVTLYGIVRATGDLDYIDVTPPEAQDEVEALAGRESSLAKKYRVFLHAVGVGDLPDDYECRLQELDLGLQKLKLWAIDPYDLALSKLTRNSPKDREDVKALIRKRNLDFDMLYARWQKEMAPWITNRNRHELTMQLWREYFPK